ncbi:hypothetical protein C8R44DRAFT_890268 [Mycena epipterygia]|nr:hypothetical protein C8R44DRAFT_890268 [Mycena epipterygia]
MTEENPAHHHSGTAETGAFDTEELALKREVLSIGPLGPISAAAREWLARNEVLVAALRAAEGAKPVELVTAEEKKAQGDRLVELRLAGLEKKAANKGVSKRTRDEHTDVVAEVQPLLMMEAHNIAKGQRKTYGVAEHERAKERIWAINEHIQREVRAISHGGLQRAWLAEQGISGTG